MNKAVILLAAAALPLGACTSTTDDSTLATVGTGAALGAAGGAGGAAIAGGDVLPGAATGAAGGGLAGAGAGAVIGGLGVLEGAAIGAAVGGLAGAVWADANNDGCADGYVREGQYYSGSPVVQPTNVAYTGERG